jgi:hypothetical protein
VSDLTLTEAMDNIYASLRADNADLDAHIAALKAAMAREGARRRCSSRPASPRTTGRGAS